MKNVLVLAIALSCCLGVEAQKAPPSTEAAKKWLHGLDLRRPNFERLLADLKSGALGPKANVPGGTPRSLACPVALEGALVSALTDAHFMNGSSEDFHLVFKATKTQMLDVSYTYDSRGTLLMTGIHRLPDGWAVGMQPGEITAGRFIVTTDDTRGCIFLFDFADPFASKAIVAE